MIDVTSTIKSAFKNKRANVIITGTQPNGDIFTITNNKLVNGGLTIDKYTTLNQITLGNCVASELTLQLYDNGYFKNISLQGSQLEVKLEIEGTQVRIGYYYIDSVERKLDRLTIKALDRMTLFDAEIKDESFFMIDNLHRKNVVQLIDSMCTQIGLNWDAQTLVNAEYTPNSNIFYKGMTYRKVLQYIAEINGENAVINNNGILVFVLAGSTETITKSDRYSSNIAEKDINIDGLSLFNRGVTLTLPSEAKTTIKISDNRLLDHNYTSVLNNILSAGAGVITEYYQFRPCEMTVKSMPYIEPMDTIVYEDREGVLCRGVVTHVTYTLNRNTLIQCSSVSDIESNYSAIPQKYVTSDSLSDPLSEDYRNVTEITEDTIRTTNLIAEFLKVRNIECLDSNNNPLLVVNNTTKTVSVGKWNVNENGLSSVNGGQIVVENSGADMYKLAFGVNFDNYYTGYAGKPAIELTSPNNTYAGDPSNTRYIPIVSFRANNNKLYYLVIVCPNGTTDTTQWYLTIHDQSMYGGYNAHPYTDPF